MHGLSPNTAMGLQVTVQVNRKAAKMMINKKYRRLPLAPNGVRQR